jgi:hypothetical protein
MNRFGRGWRGDSARHSLAAKGIHTKQYAARKAILMEPVFYAQKNETDVPMAHILGMVKNGDTYPEMKRMHPDADAESLRKRGIKAIDSREGNSAMRTIDENGVDKLMLLAKGNSRLKEQVKGALANRQYRSFIADVKVNSIMERCG